MFDIAYLKIIQILSILPKRLKAPSHLTTNSFPNSFSTPNSYALRKERGLSNDFRSYLKASLSLCPFSSWFSLIYSMRSVASSL